MNPCSVRSRLYRRGWTTSCGTCQGSRIPGPDVHAAKPDEIRVGKQPCAAALSVVFAGS